jgi:hypothetical protein
MYNIIVIGAHHINSNNNPNQASHDDMIKLLKICKNEGYECKITCYDPMYGFSRTDNNIQYINKIFELGDTKCLIKNAKNIIIEFCNLLDEHAIHHGMEQHNNLMKYCLYDGYNSYDVCFLACGCSWNNGFPIDCIMNVIKYNMYTPCNALDVNCLVYVIANIQYIYSKNIEDVMEPYIDGLCQVIGTFKWRSKESEGVVRQLFREIEGSMHLPDYFIERLEKFMEYKSKWNEMPWSLREYISNFVYNKFV